MRGVVLLLMVAVTGCVDPEAGDSSSSGGQDGSSSSGGGSSSSYQQLPPVGPVDYAVAEETVTDGITGLMWQRTGSTTEMAWADALTHCQSQTLGGLSGWRLPTYAELRTLVDYTHYGPAIHPDAFPNTPTSNFWTSTPSAAEDGSAWYVSFLGGFGLRGAKTDVARARCVRTSVEHPAPAEDYTVLTDTVTDNRTGLTWQRQSSEEPRTWNDAQALCTGGWRLPNIRELESLVDFSAAQPAVDGVAFPGTPDTRFWSSTPNANPQGYAWVVDFKYGGSMYYPVSSTGWVRCVR